MHRAILVCNSVFPEDPAGLPSLNGPCKDGLILWRTLISPDLGLFPDENVQVLYERSSYETLEAIEDFFETAEADDVCLLYYSGHGRRHGRELVLCARNTKTARLQATGVSCSVIKRIIENSHAKAVIVILDCCYGAAFKGEPSAEALAGRGVYIISAAGAGELADDAIMSSSPSPFTKALVESLIEVDGTEEQGLGLDALHKRISKKIAGRQPIPWKSFDGSGIVRITAPRPAALLSGRAGAHKKSDLDKLDEFDKLITDLGKPTPKFGSAQRLIDMGPELYDGCVRVITSICPGESDMLGDMRPNERRLADRLRSILVQRMPESGVALANHIDFLIRSGEFTEASRLVRFMDTDLVTSSLVPTYQKLVEAGQFPKIAGQLIEDAIEKYSIDPHSWHLEGLEIDSGAWLRVTLNQINLARAEIRDARFYHCQFLSCNIAGSKFIGCTLSDCSFDGSDLSDSIIASGKRFQDHVYMDGASLRNCNLNGVEFKSIHTFFEHGRRGRTPQLPDEKKRISFRGSNLAGASFLDCDLRGADFSHCEGIEQAGDFSNTRLYVSTGLDDSALQALIGKGASDA
ncbi:MAG: Caspase domain protein [Gemmatimonadales bacterium]|nr:Caspase domain protein [Gemmatimonadales bacterium]